MISIREIHPFDSAVDEAERCRKDAKAAIEQNPGKYGHLNRQPSGWCVVTQKGFWSRAYHNGYGEERLKEVLDHGHRVLLTVGIVAKPDSPLSPDSHVAAVKVAMPEKLSDLQLQLISVRAKLHAARALLN